VLPFTEQDWNLALSNLAEVVGPEALSHSQNAAARVLAALPYLAGSEDPDRFAVSNLLTFHAATKVRALFDHRPDDDADVFRRLATIHVGNHADPRVVDYALSLLALISLNDHQKDREADARANKYNPVGAGVWDPLLLRKELLHNLDHSPSLKAAFTLAVPEATTDLEYWIP